jgi:hypothetical protein
MVSSVAAARAGAVSPCPCTGSGMALSGSLVLPTGSLAVNVTGDPCGAAVSLGFPTVTASTACSSFDPATCTASSSIARLNVFGLITADLIESTATAPTDPADCFYEGTFNIVHLNVLGTDITVSGAINQAITINGLALQATVVLNSQVCDEDELTVAAVKLIITGIGTNVVLTIAETKASSTCCKCTNDDPGEPPTTEPPTSEPPTSSPPTTEPPTTEPVTQPTTSTTSNKQQLASGDNGDTGAGRDRAPAATPVKPGDVTFTG